MARTVDRPQTPYLGTRELDDAMLIITQLMTELWIVKDRVAVLERLLEERAVLQPDEVSAYVPDAALTARLNRERDAFVRQVMGAPFTTTTTIAELRGKADVE